jgi:hypothetical protein
MRKIEGLNRDFRDLLLCLHQEGADFLIVGAYAVAWHGVPRATGDLDAFVRATSENALKVWNALARFGAPLVAQKVTVRDFCEPGVVYQIGQPPRRIDILTKISGLNFSEAWESRVPGDLDGATVYFIGRDALLQNKTAAGRAKDLADVERLTKKKH